MSSVPSVEPSLTITHLTGSLVWQHTALIVCSRNASSFRAGVIRTYVRLQPSLFPVFDDVSPVKSLPMFYLHAIHLASLPFHSSLGMARLSECSGSRRVERANSIHA